MDIELWKAALGVFATIGSGYLLYRGATRTAGAAKEGVHRTARVDEQQSALDAWKGLNEPILAEVGRLRDQVADLLRQQDTDKADRNRHDVTVQQQLDAQTHRLTGQAERIDLLTVEVKHWKSMAKAIARWATTLRDQVISLGGSVPSVPDELLLAQLLDDDTD
jgi:hypothetical protein